MSNSLIVKEGFDPVRPLLHQMSAEMGYLGYSNFCLGNYKFGGFCWMPSGLVISWDDSHNSGRHCMNYYWLTIKGTPQGTAKCKRCVGQGVGVGDLLALPSVPPSQCHVRPTNCVWALWIPLLRGLCGCYVVGYISGSWQLTQSSASLPSLEGWEIASGGSEGKVSAYSAGDRSSVPGSGRSPGEGNGTPLQYSCLENPVDREAWQATVHGVAKSLTWLSDSTFTFHF